MLAPTRPHDQNLHASDAIRRSRLSHLTLLARHVALFNQGVRSGDFAPMLEQFSDDAELVFEGVPTGPFHGKETIAAAYESNPPHDEVDVLSSEQADDGTIVARYAWRANGDRPAGRMIFTPRGEQIARLVVTFEPA